MTTKSGKRKGATTKAVVSKAMAPPPDRDPNHDEWVKNLCDAMGDAAKDNGAACDAWRERRTKLMQEAQADLYPAGTKPYPLPELNPDGSHSDSEG